MIEIREYIATQGRSPYARWFDGLNARAAAKVDGPGPDGARQLLQRQGRRGRCLRFGPGYRVYFGKDGDTLIILLGGGTKKRQQKDIETAQDLWREYKQRKRQET